MTIRREGGSAPKWNRLHPSEMGEVKECLERLVGRELTTSDLVPVWAVLSKWAGHRYKVCRNNVWQDEKRKRGGRKVDEVDVMPPVPQEVVVEVISEEKLPWD